VWDLFRSSFSADTPKEEDASQSGARDPAVAKQAVDAAARNALLEIHFRDMKDRKRAVRRVVSAGLG
jgi:hypothetical protein